MKHYLLIFVFIAIGYSGFGQIIDWNREQPYKKVFVDTDNFGSSYLKTLEEALVMVDNDTIQFSILNDLAYYWHTRNLNKALEFTLIGLKLTENKSNKLWHGRFQITQGSILLRMEKLDEALEVLHEASAKVTQQDLAFLHTQLGYVYERKGEIDKAADYALTSLELGKLLNDKKSIALAYSDLSNLLWKQAKFEKGLEYGLKSLEIFEERGLIDLDYDFTLYVVGNNYLELKDYENAKQYFEHAIAIGERYGFYNNLSDVYISQVNLYAYLALFEKANKAGENAIKYAKLLNNNFMMMRSLLSIGKLQILEGKYISAIKRLQNSIEVATVDFGDTYYLSQAYESLGKAYAGNHNYKKAYQAFAEYDKLKNMVFTAEADQRILLLQTEFDVAQKENTILDQEGRIEKQKIRQTYISVFAGLLLLLLLLLFITLQNNRKKGKLLKNQNKEKEFLLKEIHHRVKNNLGIVSSLLDLQSAQMKDPKMINAIQESQNRVHSMSMIHQKLYQGKNLAAIEMKDYFINLSKHISDSYGVKEQVSLTYDMEKVELDVDTAIPLGLLVNELLTNAFKYAFPNRRKGNVNIGLQVVGGQTIKLRVEDNGVGQFKNEVIHGTGFGTELIKLLTIQLDGKMHKTVKDGTSVSFEFNFEKMSIIN
ncbi:MAG: histidine kinase [Flavobacteriaceae bacterium]|nr:histidine kinase [Flavobacteriaceae bacterium]